MSGRGSAARLRRKLQARQKAGVRVRFTAGGNRSHSYGTVARGGCASPASACNGGGNAGATIMQHWMSLPHDVACTRLSFTTSYPQLVAAIWQLNVNLLCAGLFKQASHVAAARTHAAATAAAAAAASTTATAVAATSKVNGAHLRRLHADVQELSPQDGAPCVALARCDKPEKVSPAASPTLLKVPASPLSPMSPGSQAAVPPASPASPASATSSPAASPAALAAPSSSLAASSTTAYPLLEIVEFTNHGSGTLAVRPDALEDMAAFLQLMEHRVERFLVNPQLQPRRRFTRTFLSATSNCTTWHGLEQLVGTLIERAIVEDYHTLLDEQARRVAAELEAAALVQPAPAVPSKRRCRTKHPRVPCTTSQQADTPNRSPERSTPAPQTPTRHAGGQFRADDAAGSDTDAKSPASGGAGSVGGGRSGGSDAEAGGACAGVGARVDSDGASAGGGAGGGCAADSGTGSGCAADSGAGGGCVADSGAGSGCAADSGAGSGCAADSGTGSGCAADSGAGSGCAATSTSASGFAAVRRREGNVGSGRVLDATDRAATILDWNPLSPGPLSNRLEAVVSLSDMRQQRGRPGSKRWQRFVVKLSPLDRALGTEWGASNSDGEGSSDIDVLALARGVGGGDGEKEEEDGGAYGDDSVCTGSVCDDDLLDVDTESWHCVDADTQSAAFEAQMQELQRVTARLVGFAVVPEGRGRRGEADDEEPDRYGEQEDEERRHVPNNVVASTVEEWRQVPPRWAAPYGVAYHWQYDPLPSTVPLPTTHPHPALYHPRALQHQWTSPRQVAMNGVISTWHPTMPTAPTLPLPARALPTALPTTALSTTTLGTTFQSGHPTTVKFHGRAARPRLVFSRHHGDTKH